MCVRYLGILGLRDRTDLRTVVWLVKVWGGKRRRKIDPSEKGCVQAPSVAADNWVPYWGMNEAISRAVVIRSSYAVEPRKSRYRNEDLLELLD